MAVPHQRAILTSACLMGVNLLGGIFALHAARGRDRMPWLLVAATARLAASDWSR